MIALRLWAVVEGINLVWFVLVSCGAIFCEEREEEMMFEWKDSVRSSDNMAERVLVWSKEAKKKEEEE